MPPRDSRERLPHRRATLSRQRKCYERIPRLRPRLSPSAGGDDDVLLPVHHVRAWRRIPAGGELVIPEQLSGRLVERVEFFVLGPANEDQAAGGDDGAAEVFGAGGRDALGGQLGVFAE